MGIVPALAMFLLLAGAADAAPIALEDVSIRTSPDGAVVEIRTSGHAAYQAARLDSPPRLVVDVAGATYAWRGSPLAAVAEPVRLIRGSQHGADVARIVIELSRASDYRVERTPTGLRVTFPALAEAAPPAPPSKAPGPRPATQAPVLSGVVKGERGWVAYLEDPGTKSVAGYRVGDTFGALTVEAIDADRVVLAGPSGRLEVRIAADKPGGVIRRAPGIAR